MLFEFLTWFLLYSGPFNLRMIGAAKRSQGKYHLLQVPSLSHSCNLISFPYHKSVKNNFHMWHCRPRHNSDSRLHVCLQNFLQNCMFVFGTFYIIIKLIVMSIHLLNKNDFLFLWVHPSPLPLLNLFTVTSGAPFPLLHMMDSNVFYTIVNDYRKCNWI